MDTWLCTFSVQCDLPNTMSVAEMEAAIAQSLAIRLPALGYSGNVIVTLVATAGNQSVLDQGDNPGYAALGGDPAGVPST